MKNRPPNLEWAAQEAIVEFLKAYLDLAIFGLLGLMSFFLIWFVVERLLFYSKINLDDYTHIEALNIALTKRLTAIASIGSNAPYIGLLGTVLGILIAFYDMGQGGKIEAGEIMLGLALALKATALGLVVAIPAIMFYNALTRKVDVITAQWKQQNQS